MITISDTEELSITLDQSEAISIDLGGGSIVAELTESDGMTVVLSDTDAMLLELSDQDAIEVEMPFETNIDDYEGDYEVVPKTYGQTLATANKRMTDDVTVTAIPYYETSNADGTTVYIANTVA